MAKVVIEQLYKIFDPRPADALALLRQGVDKDTVFARTGKVVGVNKVSFSIEAGEIFVLMGLSGSGKSTLIRLINRLIDPSSGQICVDGADVAKLSTRQLQQLRRRDMSMVFQSFALMPHRCVLDNVAFGLDLAGVSRRERNARAIRVLEQVGLGPYAQKYPHQLSGGMQQRVGLARALAVGPSLMLMDEAFSALDPLKRKEMQELLLELQREERRTIVFVSHDLEEALHIGNRIAIMEGGRLVQVGTPEQIIARPADDFVRAFFRSVDTSRYLLASDLLCGDGIPTLVRGAAQVSATASRRQPWLAFVDADGKWLGMVNTEALADCGDAQQALRDGAHTVAAGARLREVLPRLMQHPAPLAVIDGDGAYLGVITAASALRKISPGGLHA